MQTKVKDKTPISLRLQRTESLEQKWILKTEIKTDESNNYDARGSGHSHRMPSSRAYEKDNCKQVWRKRMLALFYARKFSEEK